MHAVGEALCIFVPKVASGSDRCDQHAPDIGQPFPLSRPWRSRKTSSSRLTMNFPARKKYVDLVETVKDSGGLALIFSTMHGEEASILLPVLRSRQISVRGETPNAVGLGCDSEVKCLTTICSARMCCADLLLRFPVPGLEDIPAVSTLVSCVSLTTS